MSVLWTDLLVNGIAGAVLAAILGFIALPLVLRFAWKKQWLDIPDERKLHDAPTPRVAGLVFFPVILAVVLILSTREEINSFPRPIIGLLFGCTFVYMIEFIDDLRSVSWKSKFIMQGVAAMLLILCGVWLRDLGGILGIHEIPPIVGIPLSIVLIVLVINALNLIDGIDGLAGFLCLIAMAAMFTWYYSIGLRTYLLLSAATGGVLIPFLYHNIWGTNEKQNKTFMGDTGSQILGFIISFLVMFLVSLPLKGGTTTCLVDGFALVALPVLDLVRLFFWRIIHGRSPFQPDANHIHHKLMRCGLSPRLTLVVLIALDLVFVLGNHLLYPSVNINLLLLMNIGFWMLVNGVVNLRLKRVAK